MNHCPKTQSYWTPNCPECDCEHANESAAAQEHLVAHQVDGRSVIGGVVSESRSSSNTPASAADLLKLCDEVEALKVRATPGPYFVGEDAAKDTAHHNDAGLALIDTGRTSDWPVLRLGEWPTTEYVASLLNAADALLAAARQSERMRELLRRIPDGVPIRAELREDIAKEIGT